MPAWQDACFTRELRVAEQTEVLREHRNFGGNLNVHPANSPKVNKRLKRGIRRLNRDGVERDSGLAVHGLTQAVEREHSDDTLFGMGGIGVRRCLLIGVLKGHGPPKSGSACSRIV
jgi:hypothetical protein